MNVSSVVTQRLKRNARCSGNKVCAEGIKFMDAIEFRTLDRYAIGFGPDFLYPAVTPKANRNVSRGPRPVY
jgi:hypothetical protein